MFGLPISGYGPAGWRPEAGGHQCPGPPRGQASHARGQSSVLFMDRFLGGIVGVSMALVWDLLWYFNVPR